MFFEQYSHEPYIAVVRFWLAYSGTPERFEARAPSEDDSGGYAALDAMERHLGGATFFVGERYSIADIVALRVHARRATKAASTSSRTRRFAAGSIASPAQPGHVPIDA